jgi:CRISPR system Cascade subunit CasB
VSDHANRVNIEGLVAHIAACAPAADRPGDRAALAVLRRAVGRRPGEVVEACRIVDPFLSVHVSRREEWAAYVTATIMALHPLHVRRADGRRSAGFGRSLRRIRYRDLQEDAGVERRFIALLGADSEQVAVHLRGLIVLLHDRAGDEPVDFIQLYRDLLEWDREDRRVQRDWAAGFWAEVSERTPGGEIGGPDGPGAATISSAEVQL